MKKPLQIVKWVLGISLILSSISAFDDSILQGFGALLLGLFITPFTLQLFEKAIGKTIPRVAKYGIAFGLWAVFVLAIVLVGGKKDENARIELAKALEQISSGKVEEASKSLATIDASSSTLKDSISTLITAIEQSRSQEYVSEVIGSMTNDEFKLLESGSLDKTYFSNERLNKEFITLLASNKDRRKQILKEKEESDPAIRNSKALEAIRKEPKVKEALITDAEMLYVSVLDDGTNRNGYAEYLCHILTEYKAKVNGVRVVKFGSTKDPNRDNAYGVLLGESNCEF
jgi:hypothetical protein